MKQRKQLGICNISGVGNVSGSLSNHHGNRKSEPPPSLVETEKIIQNYFF